MLVLGLESSCDETAAALVDGSLVVSEVVRSQLDLHKVYGGVVPEIASRAHLEAIEVMVTETLAQAGKSLSDLDGLAVTQGPGLVGALLVALSFAKGLSISLSLPVTGVNHVQAHALAPFLIKAGGPIPENNGLSQASQNWPLEEPRSFPLVALVVSGGHTSLFLVKSPLDFTTLGRTLDDAAGEAFDKSAKLMGLGYPGGRVIENMAKNGDAKAFSMPRPLWRRGLDFSFSGLKTQVQNVYREKDMDNEPENSQVLQDLAASFQQAVVDVLIDKLEMAVKATKVKGLIIAGGVAANGLLRSTARERFGHLSLGLPRPAWCADNGAMIAYLGSKQLEQNLNILDLTAEPKPRWPIT
ncbi:MAG: tRNA (adenosine(37)-N6)-threonylcarbamoyltransferase complex transferase subunit TsaD [Deltaproteobacteria bacterium]|jgi:N6-L-threonylcarbamoyladenine synthase|nr:tRNA (adenosine(37)-N6)-threonylcarbamoyltransferase complex transferase subunit TsaD [Deltaproteobacteria bacterium]